MYLPFITLRIRGGAGWVGNYFFFEITVVSYHLLLITLLIRKIIVVIFCRRGGTDLPARRPLIRVLPVSAKRARLWRVSLMYHFVSCIIIIIIIIIILTIDI